MTTQIRDLIAQPLLSTSQFDLPARCEHYGFEPGKETEAAASKITHGSQEGDLSGSQGQRLRRKGSSRSDPPAQAGPEGT
jgi:hypothetical protein